MVASSPDIVAPDSDFSDFDFSKRTPEVQY